MADPFLSAIGVDDSEADKPTAYEPVDAALRTVYAEASPQAGPDELRAIASVIANRAKATGKDVGAVVQQPGQFEPWATEKGRARIAALTPDGPEYQTMHDLVGGILMGDEDPSTDATHFYAPAAQAALAPVDGRPAKPAWDDGSGHQVGDHIFIAAPGQLTPKDPGDAFLSAIGVAPEEAAKPGEPEAKWAGAGITPYKGSESTLTAAQQKTYETLVKGSAMEEGAEPGSIRNPLWEGPEGSAKDAPPGSFYVTAAGKLERAPGGQKMSSAVAGGVQGLGDVATTLANVLPGTGNSEVANRLRASQMGYGAEYGGDLKSGLARFTGQVVGSAPLLAGAEAAIAPQLASRLGGVGAFLTGQAGKDMAPGTLRFLTRAGSLAAHGGAQGAGAAGLISSASDRPIGEQMGEGAVGGAFLGPVAPAVGAAGRWLGTTARSLTRPLTEGGQQGIVGDLLHEVAGGPPTLDLKEYVPGSQPTLAEAAANAGISGLERVTRTNPTLAQRFQVRLQANDEARTQFLHDLRGDPQTAADLAAARQPVVDAARERTFAATTPADAVPVVQAIDEALASPEAHMESVAKPLQALRDKVVQPPPEMTPAEVAEFHKKIGATFGAPDATALTPEVMDAARSKLGAKFEEIAGKTQVAWDDTLRNDIGQVIKDTSDVVPESSMPPLFKQLANIASTADQKSEAMGLGHVEKGPATISGASYQALTKRGAPLDALMKSADPTIRDAASKIRSALDDALERSVATMPKEEGKPDLIEELRAARLGYKNLKTAEAALRTAGPDRTVTPRALYNAVKQNFGSYTYKGGGDLGDVAEAAVKANEGRAPKVETDPKQLYGMRESLSTAIDKLESQGTDAAHLAASRLRTVMDRLDNSISTGAPDYANFRAVAERSNDPIEAMKYLNGLTLTDASGKPTLANVQRARTKIEAARNAPGKSPAKLISAATLEQLGALESDLKRASNIDLGKARGSDTRQNLATDGLAAQMGVPLALGAGALTHHPLVAPAVVGAKLVYGMKDKEIAGKLASRLLDPSAAPPAPIPVPVRSGRGPARRVGAAVLPAVGGILANRLTRGP